MTNIIPTFKLKQMRCNEIVNLFFCFFHGVSAYPNYLTSPVTPNVIKINHFAEVASLLITWCRLVGTASYRHVEPCVV